MLTASASKGRNTHYHYYHCFTACKVRYKAPIVNQQFIIQLQSFVAPRAFKMLFKEIARDLFRMKNHGAIVNRNQLSKNGMP
jgi:site-specific DNA recombinase